MLFTERRRKRKERRALRQTVRRGTPSSLRFRRYDFKNFLRKLFLRSVELMVELQKFQLLLRRKGRGIRAETAVLTKVAGLCYAFSKILES